MFEPRLDKSDLDNRQSQKYCGYCGCKMYVGFLCPNCHIAS